MESAELKGENPHSFSYHFPCSYPNFPVFDVANFLEFPAPRPVKTGSAPREPGGNGGGGGSNEDEGKNPPFTWGTEN